MDTDRAEGKKKELEGKTQQAWADVKDAVDDVWEDAKDAGEDLVDDAKDRRDDTDEDDELVESSSSR